MNRTRYLALVTRMLDAREVSMARTAFRLIDATNRRASEAYAKHGRLSAVNEAIADEAQAWKRLVIAHYAATGPDFARVALDTAKPKRGKAARRVSTFTERLMEMLRKVALAKAKALADTTKQRIASKIAAGEREGAPLREIADSIVQRDVSVARARIIARTETHYAATWSMQAQVESEPDLSTGTREWVTTLDERVRDSHAEADGQVVGIDEPFVIGGVELAVPGDQESDAPEETINCRCVVLYASKSFEEVLRGN